MLCYLLIIAICNNFKMKKIINLFFSKICKNEFLYCSNGVKVLVRRTELFESVPVLSFNLATEFLSDNHCENSDYVIPIFRSQSGKGDLDHKVSKHSV